MSDYQVLPPLSEDEYHELKADIKSRGVLVPVEYDEDGNVLDGHHRVRACAELGITAWPRLVRIGFSEEEKRYHARKLNSARRQMTQDQRRSLIQEQLKETPHLSDRQIARGLGVSNSTVSETRNEMVETGQLCESHSSIGADGKERPRATKPRSVFVSTETAKKAEDLPVEMKQQVLTGQVKPFEAQRQVRKQESQAKATALPEGKYRVIYADPPWSYNDQRKTGDHRESTSATYHYGTMSMDDLKAMPIEELAADDSVLFCWATFPLLKDAMELMESWGFKYKTAFVWDKKQGAFGHYHNAAAELLMLATRGSCTPDSDHKQDQVQTFDRLGHSRKPEEWRQLIDNLYTHGARIELFHRGEKPGGWHVWGSESEVRAHG